MAMPTINLYLCDFLISEVLSACGEKERGAACYPLCGEISGRIRSHFKQIVAPNLHIRVLPNAGPKQPAGDSRFKSRGMILSYNSTT